MYRFYQIYQTAGGPWKTGASSEYLLTPCCEGSMVIQYIRLHHFTHPDSGTRINGNFKFDQTVPAHELVMYPILIRTDDTGKDIHVSCLRRCNVCKMEKLFMWHDGT